MYRKSRNYENLEKRIYRGVGSYQIPEIAPITYQSGCEFIPFHYAKSCRNRANKGIHFFIDDYQFHRVWTNVNQYLSMLSEFDYVLSPDFSIYTDFPTAVQIYNHYRKHWLAAYWQEADIPVIPTISWGTPDSYSWCFDGEPIGGTVAVSSVGTQQNKNAQTLFLAGYQEMMERLRPKTVLFYGKIPIGCLGNIVSIPAFQERFQEGRDGR